MKVTIYSDGGSDPNPGIGGWAAILKAGKHEKVLTGNDPDATNNRMELTAAIEALRALKRPSEVEFHVDSEYVRRGITEWIGGWAERGWLRSNGTPVPNADLWKILWPLSKQHTIEWHWVKGHSGDPLNERVDQLAREARLEITPKLELDDDVLRIYMRASYRGKTNAGGWGLVLEFDGETRQYSGNVAGTTNNRMEILAAVEALSLVPPSTSVMLFTVSDYLFQGATKWIIGWKRREWKKRDGNPVSNSDLWQTLDKLVQERRVRWVNAKNKEIAEMDHAGKLAKEASADI